MIRALHFVTARHDMPSNPVLVGPGLVWAIDPDGPRRLTSVAGVLVQGQNVYRFLQTSSVSWWSLILWPCADSWVGWGEILGIGVRPRWNR